MSKNLPETNGSEEVDLGQLFKLIGNAFERFFGFIGYILNKLFLAFVWAVFFLKKHALKIGIAGVVGFGLGFMKEKVSKPIYSSHVTIKQNYKTGENLYNSIEYYNSLIGTGDTKALEDELGVSETQASSLLSFEMESVISNNDKIVNFDNYKKDLDSVIASTIKYKDYLKNQQEYNDENQRIIIKVTDKNNLSQILNRIIENVNKNEFFKREQQKDLVELTNKEKILIESLKESDSLQAVYKLVLERPDYKEASSQMNITIEGDDGKESTKEFELYQNDLELRRELVEIRREKEEKEKIIEIVSNKSSTGVIDNSREVFGIKMDFKIYYTSVLIMLTILVLAVLQFLKFLDKYKDKV